MYNKSSGGSDCSGKNTSKVRSRRKCPQRVSTSADVDNGNNNSSVTPTTTTQSRLPHAVVVQRQLSTSTATVTPPDPSAMPLPILDASASGTICSIPSSPSSVACATVSASAAAIQLVLQPASVSAFASTSIGSLRRTCHGSATAEAGHGGQLGIFPKSASFGTAPSAAHFDARTSTATLTAMRSGAATTTTVRHGGTAGATDQLTKVKKITAESTIATKKAPTKAKGAAATATTLRDRRLLTQQKQLHSLASRRTHAVAPSAAATATATEATSVTTSSALATVTLNCEKAEIKCPLKAATNASNQRKVEANATLTQQRRTTTFNSDNTDKSNNNKNCTNNKRNNAPGKNFRNDQTKSSISANNRWLPHRCELQTECAHPNGSAATSRSESTDNAQDTTKGSLNLAARKAKLKAEFFKDFARNQQRRAILPPENSSHQVTTSVVVPITVLNDISVHISAPQAIAATSNATSSSLVAQRKLDLKRKLEQKSTPKSTAQTGASTSNSSHSSRVVQLVQKFDTQPAKKMIVNPNKVTESSSDTGNILTTTLKVDAMEQRSSPLSDEGCTLGQSPYSSDNEDNDSIGTASTTIERTKRKEKVARSASSDSALGLDVDEVMDSAPAQPPAVPQQRRMTLTVTDLPLRPALLPLAEPTALPDSPTTIDLQQQSANNAATQSTAVPSKVLLEERVVELPEDPRSLGCSSAGSRRESAQSVGSDCGPSELPGGRRFVRTPSVVVSDYSDDVMCGITLEEIEYFRAQRMRRRHSSLDTANEGDGGSDVSASSSCSNLYYCGSTISALDGAECYVNGVRTTLERKTSDCSTCSASADEDSFTIPEDPQQMGKDLADLLAAQHLSTKQTKKVGLVVPMCENFSDKTGY